MNKNQLNKHGQQHCYWEEYYDNGNLNRYTEHYFNNGLIMARVNTNNNGRKVGLSITYKDNGDIRCKGFYNNSNIKVYGYYESEYGYKFFII